MSLYYRIQPAGLGIDHDSESSADQIEFSEELQPRSAGLDVFQSALETVHVDGGQPEDYEDEVVVIEAEGHWPNYDVEGVRIPTVWDDGEVLSVDDLLEQLQELDRESLDEAVEDSIVRMNPSDRADIWNAVSRFDVYARRKRIPPWLFYVVYDADLSLEVVLLAVETLDNSLIDDVTGSLQAQVELASRQQVALYRAAKQIDRN